MGLFDFFKKKDTAEADGPMGHNKKRLDVQRRFQLLRTAISGTMSKFFLAKDRESGQKVGLKIGDREKVELFEQRFKGLKKPPEGEIALQFKHPRIVETYEYGQTTDGLPYVVMEFLDGPGLQQLVHKKDELLIGKRLGLVRQMAEALDVVHQAEFIHRDVCPRNFICSPDGTSVKLIDFGLTLPAKRDFMQPGNRTGTPLYMAPEVIRRRWTDHRLDIFAFGVTAYHVCTYELPWPVAETTGMAALAHDTHPPRDILEYRPKLNPSLAKAIMKCMQPDPNDRVQSMDQFLQMIKGVDQEEGS